MPPCVSTIRLVLRVGELHNHEDCRQSRAIVEVIIETSTKKTVGVDAMGVRTNRSHKEEDDRGELNEINGYVGTSCRPR